MNEFVGEKLGETAAFCSVGSDTCQRAREALVTALGEEAVVDIEEKSRLYTDELLRIALEGDVIDVAQTEMSAVENNLKQMRDAYIGDQWHDAAKIMAWSGFFEGAAIVQWGLVRGIGEGLDHEGLLELADEAVSWHYDMLEMAEGHLDSFGQSNVSVS